MTGPIVRNQEFGSCDCKTVMRIVSPPPLSSCWLSSVGELYTEEMVYPNDSLPGISLFANTLPVVIRSNHVRPPSNSSPRQQENERPFRNCLTITVLWSRTPKTLFHFFQLKFYLPWYFVMSKTRNWRLQKSTRIGRRREIFNLNSLNT